MVTRSWKVYGTEGHRQRESFLDSWKFDASTKDSIRIVEAFNSDRTGTNDYTIMRITTDSAEECYNELMGQISDGTFENSRVGKIEEVKNVSI